MVAAPGRLEDDQAAHVVQKSNETGFAQHPATVRIRLWVEVGNGMFFGSGRALLLTKIDEHGSLRKAAEELGMSYRAAWGKIRQTEAVCGREIIERNGSRKGGFRLTRHGRFLKDSFELWFREVESCALKRAEEIFPWPVRSYREVLPDEDPQTQNIEV